MAGTDRTIRDIDFTANNVGVGQELDAKLKAAVFGEEQDVTLEAKTGPLGDFANQEALRATALDVKLELGPVTIANLMAASAKAGQPAPQPVPGDLEATAKLGGTLGEAMLEELNVSSRLLGAKEPNVKLSASVGRLISPRIPRSSSRTRRSRESSRRSPSRSRTSR